MCGVLGILHSDNSNVISQLLEGMLMLQHRGQDAAGVFTCRNGRFYNRRRQGMVKDVFKQKHLDYLVGNMGVGHTRYPTSGKYNNTETQPFYVNSPYGIVMSHNGNLTNTQSLATTLLEFDQRHINTDSDSEVLLNIFAHELSRINKTSLNQQDIFTSITRLHTRVQGAYATVGLIADYGMFGFRDPYGIRPLVYGRRKNPLGKYDYIISSESVAIDALGFEMVRDIKPSEAIVITKDGQLFTHICGKPQSYSPCIFEFVYLARADSWIDGVLVYKAQMKMGQKLAHRLPKPLVDKIDVIMPIPDTSRPIALEIAKLLKIPYREGLVKNRYVGRTFIMPTDSNRKNSVKHKLNVIRQEFDGLNVLLVDDSIVRGTTSKQIVKLAREAGAKEVYFASASPEVKYPNVYGIDMPSLDELIAHNRTNQEICDFIGADALVYQTIEDLLEAVTSDKAKFDNCETSCFTGVYNSGEITTDLLQSQAEKRKLNKLLAANNDKG